MTERLAMSDQVAGALLGAVLLATGCANECSFDEDDGDQPIAAFECPAGNLCYRGRCFEACNAGREGVDRCSTDDDCAGARPNCDLTTGTCSSCIEGESCVPTLGICRPVASAPEVPVPELPDDNTFVPEGPLDASLPDGGLVRFPDAGQPGPAQEAPTIAVHFEMAREIPIPDGATCARFPDPDARPEPRVAVRAWDVRRADRAPDATWRADLSPPATERVEDSVFRDEQCEIRRVETATTATEIDIGDVAFEDPRENERVLDNWNVRFLAGAYEASAVDGEPNPLVFVPNVRFTEEVAQLQLFGLGRSGVTNGSFGAELDLPFDFVPNCATIETLGEGFVLGAGQPRDLVVGWRNPLNGATGQTVYLRIDASDRGFELICEETESSGAANIVLKHQLVAELITLLRDGPVEVETFRLEFGRRNLRRFQVDPAPGELFFATAEVGLRYVQTITIDRR
jgi:hypothetical protein